MDIAVGRADDKRVRCIGIVSRINARDVRLLESENIVGSLREIIASKWKFPNDTPIHRSVKVLVVAADGTDHPINPGKRARVRFGQHLKLHQPFESSREKSDAKSVTDGTSLF
jgi:hypothetical protein